MPLGADAAQFYATAERVFTQAPNPNQRFTSVNYAACLKTLRAGLGGEEGLALLVGSAGVGKTTLGEDVGAWWRRGRGLVGKVNNTQVGAEDFQRLVAYAFEINARGTGSSVQIKLERLLQRQKARHKPPLLIVDEAQNLDAEALEALRLLSNLGSDYRPWLRILLVAQDDFLERLRQQPLEALRQRLRVVVQLRPLNLHETREYIAHLLCRAHWQGQPKLSGMAVQAVFQFTQGVPRWINLSMRHLLRFAESAGLTSLDASEVACVVAELTQQGLSPTNLTPTRGRDHETVDPTLRGLDAQTLLAAPAPAKSQPEPAWSNRIRIGLPILDLAGRLKNRGGRVVRALAPGRLAKSGSSGRNWAVGMGLAAVLVSALGVLLHRAPAPLAETTEKRSVTARPPLAPQPNEALLLSQTAEAILPSDPDTKTKSVLNFAPDIRSLQSAVPSVRRLSGSRWRSDARVEPALANEPALPNGEIVDQGTPERLAADVTALPSRQAGSTDQPVVTLPSPLSSLDWQQTELGLPKTSEEGAVGAPMPADLALAKTVESAQVSLSAEPVSAARNPAPVARKPSKIARLLQLAAAAIAEDRLTLPPKNNAYQYYQAVLAQEPRNWQARAGLGKIVARYRVLTKDELAAGKLVAAQRLVNRGLRVAADDRQLLALQAAIEDRLTSSARESDIIPVVPFEPIVDFLKGAIDEPDPHVHHPFEFSDYPQ